MEITLVSDQLYFEDGDVYVLRMPSSDALPSPVGAARVRANVIVGLEGAAAGLLVAIVSACTIVFLESGDRRRFSFVALTGEISSDDAIRARCDLHVGRLAVARIDVVDPSGNHLEDTAAIGLAAEGMTIEMPSTERAPLDLLLRPGEYHAYIQNQAATVRAFSVRDDDVDIGVIKLQPLPPV